ncbi:MAG TPA: DNA cytosine methyltransferase [Chthoniobacterales bacterium]|nr:DNA cytosine methyltransferase [Chthoniobacterales bacterium]
MRHSQSGHRNPKPKASSSPRSQHKSPTRKIADLFSGVGGFSLGAARAGFDVAVAIDTDRHAVGSHKENFPKTKHARRDIAKLAGHDLPRIANIGEEKLVGLIGGPPCQGFSTMGRRRKNDKRNPLFFHFFRLVSELKPLFFVAENVPGILDSKFHSLRSKALKLVSSDYNIVGPFTLAASDFGAATNRSRVFFVGVSKRCQISLSVSDFENGISSSNICVRRALAGLSPQVKPNWQSEKSSWRRVKESKGKYFTTINRFCESVGDPEAIERFLEKLEVSGFLGTRHREDVIKRFAAVPAGKMDKTSKFPRLSWNGLCPTLRAGTDSSRGSYQAVRPIHPERNRVITPREAARLQGFPDWFQFSPTKWHSFRQIGNSISPLIAEAVLDVIRCKLFPELT